MATTPQDIITAAYGRSTKNRPGTIASDASELLNLVNRLVRSAFSRMARLNPVWIMDTATVAATGSAWARPTAAQSIARIEFAATGVEVRVVPFNDRLAEAQLPAVYRLGRTFRSAGNASDPTVENLLFFYARFPTDSASLNTAIDAAFEDQFRELLVTEVALYLATKDGRNDEIQGLTLEREKWMLLFDEFLEHETANESRRFDLLNRFQAQGRRPLPGSGAE